VHWDMWPLPCGSDGKGTFRLSWALSIATACDAARHAFCFEKLERQLTAGKQASWGRAACVQ